MLQSWRWGDFKYRHAWTPERVLVDNADGTAMAQVLFRAKGPVSVGYIPRGPVLAGDPEALWRELWRAIDDISCQRRALGVIVEPNAPLPFSGTYRDVGMVKGPAHVQPSRTVKVPLLDDDQLLAQMHQKTRYNIRLASRRGVTFRRMPVSPESIAAFYGIMQDTAQRNEFAVHSLDYYADFLDVFGDDALLLGAWNDEGTLTAVLIAAVFGAEAMYMYGASSTTHRAHGAGAALQFEAMRWARERGATTYDLWGIPNKDPESVATDGSNQIAGTKGEDWRGLYRFKTGFGGSIVTFPPSLERRSVPAMLGIARRFGIISG